MKELSASYRISEGAINLYKQQLAAEEKQHKATEAATVKHRAEKERFRAEYARSTEAVKKLEAGFFGLNAAIGDLDTTELDAIKNHITLRERIDEIEQSAHIANFGFKGMADDRLEQVGQKVDLVAPKLQTSLADAFKSIPQTLIHAFESGGGILAAPSKASPSASASAWPTFDGVDQDGCGERAARWPPAIVAR